MQEETIVIDTSNIKRDAMEKKHSFAYSVGHFSNDLCAAGWFFYFTYYLKYVIKMDGGQAGLVMLAGQIADGCTTPLVGLLSDKCKTPLGSRAPWYIIGTIIVLPCFFIIFFSPMGVGNPKIKAGDADPDITTGEVAFYMIMAMLFNVGWSSVQVANMSVVNSITYSTQKRDTLVASRNTFTNIANIAFLVTSLILFKIENITSEVQFRILASIVVAVGLVSSIFYMIVLKEPYLSKEAKRL